MMLVTLRVDLTDNRQAGGLARTDDQCKECSIALAARYGENRLLDFGECKVPDLL